MMDKITVEQVKEEIENRGIKSWGLRRCSMCGVPITYRFFEDNITLDTNCGCVNYTTEPQVESYTGFLNSTFNLQTPELRYKMWGRFLRSEIGID